MGEQGSGLCNINNCTKNYGLCKICPGEEEHNLNLKDEKEPVAKLHCSDGLSAELAEVKEKYGELLMAVQSKFPDETRYETALRYIKNAETGSNEAADATSR